MESEEVEELAKFIEIATCGKKNVSSTSIADLVIRQGYRKTKTESMECEYCKEPMLKLFFCPIHTPKPESRNPHKCKCERHPDSAFTVTVKNEIPYCPRCGGIVFPSSQKESSGFVPCCNHNNCTELDNRYWWCKDCGALRDDKYDWAPPNNYYKFGKPKTMTVEEIQDVINRVTGNYSGKVYSDCLAQAIHAKMEGK